MKKIIAIILSLIAIILLLILIAGFYVLYQIKTPVSASGQSKNFIIEKGNGVRQIAAQLEEAGLIRDKLYFEIYVYFSEKKILLSGEYDLNSSMNIIEIADLLSGGKVNKNEVKITIPEGFTVKEIDARLAANGLIKLGELINYKSAISDQRSAISQQEGFLFPDTYIFSKKAALGEIVAKMRDNFNKKITPEMMGEIQKQDKTLDQIIIMASIVQQEAMSSEEMPKIAGVFYNRLNINMALQSDATVNYATGKQDRQPEISDTKINSPYNTYLNRGLPPGPICNPGLDAIKAAMYPEQSAYLYFLHPLNAPTVFSKTLEEHNANKVEWLK